MFTKAEALGQYFLNQKFLLDKPIAILSGNSIEMGIVKLAAMHIGIPFCPISVAYSTKSTDFEKIKVLYWSVYTGIDLCARWWPI